MKRIARTARTARTLALALLALAGLASASTDPPQAPVRYVPQASGQIDDFRLGPTGNLAVTFSVHDRTRVWWRGQLRHVLPGHVAALSPDGRWIATGTEFQNRLGKVRVFSADDGSLQFEWDAGPIRVVDFSPDGRLVVAGGWDGRVHLWDLADGRLVQRWEVEPQWMTSVAVSPDREFVAASAARGAWVWGLETGERRFEIDQHESFVRSIQISPDSARVVTSSQDDTVRVHDAARGDVVAVLQHGDDLAMATLTPDGSRVVTAGSGVVHVWNPETGQKEHSIELERIKSLAVAPDSRTVVVGSVERTALAFDMRTGERTASYPASSYPTRVGFSGDGRVLAVGKGTVNLYDVESGAQVLRIACGGAAAERLDFSPGGRFLLASYRSRGVVVWDLTGESEPFRSEGRLAGWTGRQAYFLAGGGCCDGRFRLWDAASRELVAELEDRMPLVVAGASPDGSILATAAKDGAMRVWSGATGELQTELSSAKSKPRSLAVPASDVVAVGFDDGWVWVWKDGEHQPWKKFHHGTRESVRHLLSSSEPRFLVSSALNERELVLWNLSGGRDQIFSGPSGAGLHDLALAPDGSELLAAWSRPEIDSWELPGSLDSASGEPRKLSAGPGEATSLAMSADGRVASGSQTGEIHLWEGGRAEPRVFDGLSSKVSGVAIDPGGRWLAGADIDGQTILWDLSAGDELVRLTTLPEGGWAVTTPTGRWDAADDGRVSGLAVWERGHSTTFPQVPQYRTPGLLQEVMAPWRSNTDAEAPASSPGDASPPVGPWVDSSQPRTTHRHVRLERLASLHVPNGAAALSVQGHHAAVGTGHGQVRLLDLSMPARPRLGELFDMDGITKRVELTNEALFATDGERFHIFSLSSEPGDRRVWKGESPWGFAVRGKHLYLADVFVGFQVVDLETPEEPKTVASISRHHLPGGPTEVRVEDQVAYVGTSINRQAGLALIDVSRPDRPEILSTVSVPANSFHDLELTGDRLLIAGGEGGLLVYDIGDPRDVRQISRYDSVNLTGVAWAGDKAFLADAVEGLLVVDLADPQAPRLVGEFGPAELGRGPQDVVVVGDELLLVSLGPVGVQVLRWSEGH